MKHHADVIIVGGGVIGCAIAYDLLRLSPDIQVTIIEKDTSYKQSSTILSDGNLRTQFNLEENIRISQYGLEMINRFADEMTVGDDRPDVAFRQQGNLFFIPEAGRKEAEQRLTLQQTLGCSVEWLTPDDIQEQYPWLHVPEASGATYGSGDGTLDPWAVLSGYKNKVIDLGATFLEAEVASLLTDARRITGVQLRNGDEIAAPVVVNAAGAWAGQLAQTANIDLPIQPVKRQVFIVESTFTPQTTIPLLLFPSGLYVIHENDNLFMLGKSFADDPVGFLFDWDQSMFYDRIWEELVGYIPSFDRLKVRHGWAGLYAMNTLDHNAILGEWGELVGFYLANGFSGHGFQQCFAVGRYLAELILGLTPTLDLSRFSPQRILDNAPVFESQQLII